MYCFHCSAYFPGSFYWCLEERTFLCAELSELPFIQHMTLLSLQMCSFTGDGLYRVPHDVQPVHTCDRLGIMHNAVEFNKFFLALEAMHESCNMSVYRNKPVYTSMLIELPKVGFLGVCDSVKEEKFYPFPLCNLQGG